MTKVAEQFKVYGRLADSIPEGAQFIAVRGTVEGRVVVTLKPVAKVFSEEEAFDREMESRSEKY